MCVPDDDRRETVLIVEDEALIRMDGSDMIEEAGYHVIEAESAAEALRILENASDIRLVFSDIDLPGSMDGLQLAEFVHRRWPGIRLLLTSGHHHLSDRDIPDDGKFVAKPYKPNDVVARIRKMLAAN